MKNYKVFAINPGSTSTKIAMFEGELATQAAFGKEEQLFLFQSSRR